MLMPIPDGRAEECARDLASDVRKITREAMKISDAVMIGEASPEEVKTLAMLKSQIVSMCDLQFYDQLTTEKFRVGDYITKNREAFTARLKQHNESLIKKIIRQIFH